MGTESVRPSSASSQSTTSPRFPNAEAATVVPAALLPTLAAARTRVAQVQPGAYARTRNAINGAVSGLSPYITHGFVSLPEVLHRVNASHALQMQHKFVCELGWREFFRHVWHHQGDSIFQSLRTGPLREEAYARTLPADIREGRTGVPVVDCAVRELYATGTLHNHARMWLASYVVHLRKVHWRAGADWLYAHLLDGDLASNHLSWQWVAGTGSSKPYVFNAENVARYAPPEWHSPDSLIDTTYEALDRIARSTAPYGTGHLGDGHRDKLHRPAGSTEPVIWNDPPSPLAAKPPAASDVEGRDVWLLHPWCLGELPADLPPNTLVLGLFLSDFHSAWPWSEARWRFVGTRMAELATCQWHGDATSVGRALRGVRSVRSVCEPHLMPWLAMWADCVPAPKLFKPVDRPCSSFSQWWSRVSRDHDEAVDLLQASTTCGMRLTAG